MHLSPAFFLFGPVATKLIHSVHYNTRASLQCGDEGHLCLYAITVQKILTFKLYYLKKLYLQYKHLGT